MTMPTACHHYYKKLDLPVKQQHQAGDRVMIQYVLCMEKLFYLEKKQGFLNQCQILGVCISFGR